MFWFGPQGVGPKGPEHARSLRLLLRGHVPCALGLGRPGRVVALGRAWRSVTLATFLAESHGVQKRP